MSLFSGGMGLDLGFEAEGFKIRLAVDNDAAAKKTIMANRPETAFLGEDLASYETAELLRKAGLKEGEATVLTGASPCEPFSTAGRRQSMQDSRGQALYEFIRVIKEAQPRYFACEQGPGFLRAAKKHMPFYERITKREEELDPDERLGSAFDEVMQEFTDTKYALSFDPEKPNGSLLNAADFGTAQKRRRFILIGSRDGPAVELPTPTHGAPGLPDVVNGKLKRWVTLKDAVEGLQETEPEHFDFPTTWGPLLALVPEGGCWRDLPEELQKEALGGAYDEDGSGVKGGRTGFLRRLAWDRPAPTLVDRPTTKAGALCHPEGLRPLSYGEYRRLQGFPDDWIIEGSLASRYQLVGQATPVPLAQAVARSILKRIRKDQRSRA